MRDETVRDWRAGDGLRCKYATRAPVEVPCGRPVKTRSYVVSHVRNGERHVTEVLCANHAKTGASIPSKLRAQADRIARERVLQEHFADYQKYLRDAVADLQEGR